jgi:hypothetical protein
MTYYLDLSPYRYYEKVAGLEYFSDPRLASINVGWLDGSMEYPTDITNAEFKRKLLEFCFSENVVNQTRGFHVCNLADCPCPLHSPEQRDGQIAYFGGAEIRVVGRLATYAAPTLIYHYVVIHNYKPPEDFIDAILTSPAPNSDEYQDLRRKIKLLEEAYWAVRREQTKK